MWDPSLYPARSRQLSSPVPPPGYDPSTSRSATNGFAVAALVLGLLAPCGAGLLSIVFGIIALVQIKRTPRPGKWLAIGGLAATGAWLVAIPTVVLVGGVDGSGDQDGSGQVAEASWAWVDPRSLVPGDCVDGLSGAEAGAVTDMLTVPCAQPHDGEVYARFSVLEYDAWPGDAVLVAAAEGGCLDELAAYSPASYDDPQVRFFYLHPTQASWRLGYREITCIAYFLDGRRTGSLSA